LKDIPVVLFSGTNDWIVYPQVMVDVQTQLRSFVDVTKTTVKFDTAAAHVWSLDNGECSCGACGERTARVQCCDVNNCNYDLSGVMLSKWYGDLKPRGTALFEY
jgi:hypothetical protein